MLRTIAGPAAALLMTTSLASAQGILLAGDARLGLGYNIDNDGDATGEDKLRTVSRVRFGVLMTGESASGLTFGAGIRADNAEGGQGGADGQFEGEVFVAGARGTLTFGDTNGADEQHVGDLNEVGLTCLGCENETPFISNGGGFGDDDELNFANDPFARPTVRYDYQWGGFGVSLSSDRDLDSLGAGASWTGDVGGGSITIGGGYYKYAAFTALTQVETVTTEIDGRRVELEAVGEEATVPEGEQWSAALGGEFGAFNGKVIYTGADSDGDAGFETLGAGLGAGFGNWALNLYYVNVLDAFGSVDSFDGGDSLGFGVNYDLGGGALAQFGVADTYAAETVADFGIAMEF